MRTHVKKLKANQRAKIIDAAVAATIEEDAKDKKGSHRCR
jgi:hypothetical protein